jgi:hypothetical protein
MDSFLQSLGSLSLLLCVIACGVFAPWAVSPLAIWFVLSVIWEYWKLKQESL